jgi:Ca2+-binding RTX toxin-like protein
VFIGGNDTPITHTNFKIMAFKFLMPWEQSFQGSNANDTVLNFGGSNKSINVGEGNNLVYSIGNNNEATSGNGNDTFLMLGGDQTIKSTGGDNWVLTGYGDDTISLGGGDDSVTSFGGNNTIGTGDGDDRITTGNGRDWLIGGGGDDVLSAGGGFNYMNGGEGDDTLIGKGTVMDAMTGGSGADLFDISEAQGDVQINDFSFAEGDVLRMDQSIVGAAFYTGSLQQGNDAIVDYSGGTITVKGFFSEGEINFNQIELV